MEWLLGMQQLVRVHLVLGLVTRVSIPCIPFSTCHHPRAQQVTSLSHYRICSGA